MVFKIFGMVIAEAYNCIFSHIPSGSLSKGIIQTTQSKNPLDGHFKNRLSESLLFELGGEISL